MANRNQHSVLLLITLWSLNHNNVIEALTARACKDGVINLACDVGQTIQVTNIRLYDSSCVGSNCCPALNDCNGAASFSHTQTVHNSCNGQRKCAVNVEFRNIGCGWLAPKNDYETITYDCLDGPTTTTTTKTTTTTTSTTESRVPSSTGNRKSDSGLDSTSPNLHHATNDGQTIREILSMEDHTPESDNKLDESNKADNEMEKKKEGEKGKEGEGKFEHLRENVEIKSTEKGFIDRLENIVAMVTGGLILLAIIISLACLIARHQRIKMIKAREQSFSLSSVVPVTTPSCNGGAAASSCAGYAEASSYHQSNPYDRCETYDSIGEVEEFGGEDGYLKPAALASDARNSGLQKKEEEERYSFVC